MVRLYIEGNEIELDKSVEFSITKQFEDLNNPTVIINDWSKTVEIPATKINNKIFGNIYSPDKVVVSGGVISTGIYFDPTKKLDFRLECDGCVLMIGYAKMIDIKRIEGKTTYNITLNGELGKVFQELKKITFDRTAYASGTTEYTNYVLDGSEYVSEEINATLVKSMWEKQQQSTLELKKKTDTGYDVTDIIGFAPNNSFSEEFDYTTFQIDENTSKTFVDELESVGFKSETGVDASTVIGDGLLPRDIGEYRSYQQIPYVFFNKLFQMFQKKAEALTGYVFELSNTWFTNSNAYWSKLVFMLKNLINEKNKNIVNKYHTQGQELNYEYDSRYEWGYNFGVTSLGDFTIDSEQYPMYNSMYHTFSPYTENGFYNNSTLTFNAKVSAMLNRNLPSLAEVRLNPAAGIEFIMYYKPTYTTFKGIIIDEDSTRPTTDFDYVLRVGKTNIQFVGDKIEYTFSNITANLPYDAVFGGFYIRTGLQCRSSVTPGLSLFQYKYNGSWSDIVVGNMKMEYTITDLSVDFSPYIFKTGSVFTFNDLWDNEYNLFNSILNYCKMCRIYVICDSINKKLIFKPYKEFFANYTIEDWTDKLDTSKEMKIQPITFDNKYVLFNYDDNNTKLCSEYVDKYGGRYGEYKVITQYNFNTDTTNLFEGIKQQIINTNNVLSWNNLYSRKKVVYSVPNEHYIHCSDKDNKFVSCFGTLLFHNGISQFDTTYHLYLRNVYISDDTSLQRKNNTFFYSQGTDGMTTVSTYPNLSMFIRLTPSGILPVTYGLCTFGTPKVNYSSYEIPYNTHSIYERYWSNYISERYNIQNKIVTCYLKMSKTDYINFKFNKFIKIENQLYLINKIYNYDITNNETTKVDLITVQDLQGYIS